MPTPPPGMPRAATPEGQAGLDAIQAAPAGALIAVDFDGTLAPIVADPAAARAQPGAAAVLARLAGSVGTVAIITGRPAAAAVALGGFDHVPGLIVLGHYGAERWENAAVTAAPVPGGVAEARALLPGVLAQALAGTPDALDGPAEAGRAGRAHRDGRDAGEGPGPGAGNSVSARRGVRIEDKGNALAVHTRNAADPAHALEVLRRPLAALAGQTGLIMEPGRLVLELRPPGSDKGTALRGLAGERHPESVLFCGDDLGDLAAFAAVRALRAEHIPGCTIASRSPETPQVAEAADLVVDGPPGVVALLAALAGILAAP